MPATGRAAARTNELGEIVKKLNALAVTLAMLFVPAAFADDLGGVVQDRNHYCDPEFIGNALPGEKLDSAPGEVTREEIDRVAATLRRKMTSSNEYRYGYYSDSGIPPAVMNTGHEVPPSNEGE
jgi:hypothetical protein